MFEKGNRWWEKRSSHGRKPVFSHPDNLWDAACQYFEWNESNPFFEIKSYQYQGVPVQDQVPKPRAMTEAALCIYLDISTTCWEVYKNKDDFKAVTTRICEIIRTQKFQGAASEFFNANIIARDLGLSDKRELSGKDGGPIETKELSDLEIARRIAFTLSKATHSTEISNKQEKTDE